MSRATNSPMLYGQHEAHERIGWHMHSSAYAAVVLDGGYREAGDSGRFEVRPGQVLFHRPFEGHCDEFGARFTRILNLSVPPNCDTMLWLAEPGHVTDPDALVRLAERDAAAAAKLLLLNITPLKALEEDWPDLLASSLRDDPKIEIGTWARRHKLAPATVSRGFRRVFGISPARYRRRQRLLAALKAIQRTTESLADVAAASGFTDQAHMTHELRWMTGATPAAWRKDAAVKLLQDRQAQQL